MFHSINSKLQNYPSESGRNYEITIGVSLAASIVGYVNPTNDEWVPGLQPVQIEPVPDPKRQGVGGSGGLWGLA